MQEKSGPAPQRQRQERYERQGQHPARAEEQQCSWPPAVACEVHEGQGGEGACEVGPGAESQDRVEFFHEFRMGLIGCMSALTVVTRKYCRVQ